MYRFQSITIFIFTLIICSMQIAEGDDLLSCSPNEETETALVICAIARGGCIAASSIAENNDQKRFLLSEGCSALAAEITGEGYNIYDFLGAGIAQAIDSKSTAVLNDNDPDNDWIGYFGKVATGIYKIGSFAQCVDKAKHKCRRKWADENPDMIKPTSNINEIVINATKQHFEVDSKCDLNQTMAFYNEQVYYEYKVFDIDYIRKTKEAVCKRYTNDSSLFIRNNSLVVSNFPEDSSIKVVDYNVDFDVYTIEQGKRITGTTSVRLAFRTDTKTPKIIGEIHKKLTKEKRCIIGFNGENLLYFHYNGEKFEYGVRVVSIIENTPAKLIRLQHGDILYKIDNFSIKDMNSLANYINTVPCKPHKIFILRNQSLYEAAVTPVLSNY